MKKSLIIASAISLFVSVSSAFAAPDLRDFDVLNETGYTITHIYVDETSSDVWTEDVLGENNVLEDEQYVPIEFAGFSEKVCNFDMRITFETEEDEAEDSWIIRKINLCKVGTVTLGYDGKTVKYKTSGERM